MSNHDLHVLENPKFKLYPHSINAVKNYTIHPNGKQIAFFIIDRKFKNKLCIYDYNTQSIINEIIILENTDYLNVNLKYTPDGKNLIMIVSDDIVIHVFKFNLLNNKISKELPINIINIENIDEIFGNNAHIMNIFITNDIFILCYRNSFKIHFYRLEDGHLIYEFINNNNQPMDWFLLLDNKNEIIYSSLERNTLECYNGEDKMNNIDSLQPNEESKKNIIHFTHTLSKIKFDEINKNKVDHTSKEIINTAFTEYYYPIYNKKGNYFYIASVNKINGKRHYNISRWNCDTLEQEFITTFLASFKCLLGFILNTLVILDPYCNITIYNLDHNGNIIDSNSNFKVEFSESINISNRNYIKIDNDNLFCLGFNCDIEYNKSNFYYLYSWLFETIYEKNAAKKK